MKNILALTKQIIYKLSTSKQSISFAESCTGGQIASAFTAISGASSVFNGSVVSYSNEIKSKWLKVKEQTLIEYGAVSKECVEEMLNGIIKMSVADYAIAVSGIAGPSGGSKEKPVGTVYIGLQTPKKQEIFHCFFEGSREEIQKQATAFAIKKLGLFLEI